MCFHSWKNTTTEGLAGGRNAGRRFFLHKQSLWVNEFSATAVKSSDLGNIITQSFVNKQFSDTRLGTELPHHATRSSSWLNTKAEVMVLRDFLKQGN
jgi:hypothetical protein